MKKILFIVVMVLIALPAFSSGNSDTQNIMTFNLRFNNPNDGENAWPLRKDNAVSMIRFYDADIVGCQEALIDQVEYLDEKLDDYSWYGLGRDDGKKDGEIMAVFYKTDRYKVLMDSTIWLSQTPTQPGKGWDAACNRTITVLKFQDKNNQKIFYLFNTHFDHRGQEARRKSAQLLIKSVKEIAGKTPFVITGDFNMVPESEPYQIITSSKSPKIIDAKTITQLPHHGPTGTSTGFKIENIDKKKRIDYIFTGTGIQVLRHATLSDTFDGKLPSDHFPVLAEIKLP